MIPMFYKSKFVKFNFTLCVVGKKKGYCYLCDETRGKWGANEIPSCLETFLTVITRERIIWLCRETTAQAKIIVV